MYLRGILRNVEGREVFGNVQHWQTSLRRLRSRTGLVRVRAAGFTGSISSPLCPSEIPRTRLDTAIEIFLTKKLHRRSYLLVERHKTFLSAGRNFASNPRPLASTGQLLSKFFLVQGRSTSFQMEIGTYYFWYTSPRDFYHILSHWHFYIHARSL